jgi:hypothetical protein
MCCVLQGDCAAIRNEGCFILKKKTIMEIRYTIMEICFTIMQIRYV